MDEGSAIDALLIVEADNTHITAEVAYTLNEQTRRCRSSPGSSPEADSAKVAMSFIFGSHLEDIYEVEEYSAWVEEWEGPTQPPNDQAPRS